MKLNLLYQITAAPEPLTSGGPPSPDPLLSALCPQLNLLNSPPPPNKIPGYATVYSSPISVIRNMQFGSNKRGPTTKHRNFVRLLTWEVAHDVNKIKYWICRCLIESCVEAVPLCQCNLHLLYLKSDKAGGKQVNQSAFRVTNLLKYGNWNII